MKEKRPNSCHECGDKKEVEDLVAKANAPEELGSKLTVVIKR